jgi:hypothetical protein
VKHFQACPEPSARRWDLPSAGLCTFRLATVPELEAVDLEWAKLRRVTDTHGFDWKRVFLEVRVCVYGFGPPDDIHALFGTRAKALDLDGVATRRLDFFQVSPAKRGTEVARLAFAAFARFALDLGETQLVLGSLPATKVVAWYEGIGGRRDEPKGWHTDKVLVKFFFPHEQLLVLAENADAVEQENLT